LDIDDGALAGLEVRYPGLGAQRQRLARCIVATRVHFLAARHFSASEFFGIERRLADALATRKVELARRRRRRMLLRRSRLLIPGLSGNRTDLGDEAGYGADKCPDSKQPGKALYLCDHFRSSATMASEEPEKPIIRQGLQVNPQSMSRQVTRRKRSPTRSSWLRERRYFCCT